MKKPQASDKRKTRVTAANKLEFLEKLKSELASYQDQTVVDTTELQELLNLKHDTIQNLYLELNFEGKVPKLLLIDKPTLSGNIGDKFPPSVNSRGSLVIPTKLMDQINYELGEEWKLTEGDKISYEVKDNGIFLKKVFSE